MVKHIRVSSVLGSLTFILPFLFGALVIVSLFDNNSVQIFFMVATGVVLGVYILSFIGIMIFGDHKELQSEEHLFRMKALEIIGDQKQVVEDIKKINLETNPAIPKPSDKDGMELDKENIIKNE